MKREKSGQPFLNEVTILEDSFLMDVDLLFVCYYELPRVPGLFELSLVVNVFFIIIIIIFFKFCLDFSLYTLCTRVATLLHFLMHFITYQN